MIRSVVVDKFEGGGGNIISWKEGPFNFPLGRAISSIVLDAQCICKRKTCARLV